MKEVNKKIVLRCTRCGARMKFFIHIEPTPDSFGVIDYADKDKSEWVTCPICENGLIRKDRYKQVIEALSKLTDK